MANMQDQTSYFKTLGALALGALIVGTLYEFINFIHGL